MMRRRLPPTIAVAWLLTGSVPGLATPLGPGALAAAGRGAGVQVGAAIDVGIDAAREALVAAEFTSVTLENRLKWGPLAPAPGALDFSQADPLIDFAERAGLRIRGHTLFWSRLNGSPGWLPGEVAAAADPAARLEELMREHAHAVVGRYAGRVAQWDVVNEPLQLTGAALDPGNLFFETLGETYLDIAFAAARTADPTAALFLNETLTEISPKFDGLLVLAERLLARGVPLDGLGLQGHFLFGPPDPALLRDQLERVAAIGLLVELTEVDIPLSLFAGSTDPLADQARAYADVFAACAAVVACTGVTTWGVDDSRTWLDSFPITAATAPNRPLLFDAGLAPKPAYHASVAALRAVPEPAPGLLIGSALLMLLRRQRRSRARRRSRLREALLCDRPRRQATDPWCPPEVRHLRTVLGEAA